MNQPHLYEHLSAVRDAFDAHAADAPNHADPSWFAHRGYLTSAGAVGAGHLAWERIAPELARLRATYTRLGRPFRDHELAFVMAYGLGLTDQGAMSHADADELADAVMPAAAEPRPLYRAPVFWMMTLAAVLLDISVAFAVSVDTPAYPTLSAPLNVVSAERVTVEREQPKRKAAPTVREVKDPVTAVLEGTGDLRAALNAMTEAPAAERNRMARRLFAGLRGAERLALVKALGDIPGEATSSLIRRAYRARSVEVVRAALSASVSRGDRRARTAIASLLTHADESVKLRALEALSVLGTMDEAHAILPCLEDEATHKAARRALKDILGVDKGKRVSRWRRYLHRRARRAR